MEELETAKVEGYAFVAVKDEPTEDIERDEPAEELGTVEPVALQAQLHENQKQQNDSSFDEAQGAFQYAKSITHGSDETAEDIFGKFVASELQQMSSNIRRETKAKIMMAIMEGIKRQSILSHKTVSQTSCQDLLSTVSFPGTSTVHSGISTASAVPEPIPLKKEIIIP